MNRKMTARCIVIICWILLIASFTESVKIDEISYAVTINFNGKYSEPVSAKLVEGNAAIGEMNLKQEYKLQLTSFNNENLDSRQFEIPDYWADIDIVEENGTFIMFLPYYTNAQKVEIYRGEIKLSELDISGFASCNEDKFCSLKENPKECPEDCTIKEIKLPVIEKPQEVTTEQKPAVLIDDPKVRLFILIAGILLIILIALVYFANKNPRGKK